MLMQLERKVLNTPPIKSHCLRLYSPPHTHTQHIQPHYLVDIPKKITLAPSVIIREGVQ